MASISELVQTNFKLNAELRDVKNELCTLKAIKQMEDSDEVARIKAAYLELEQEVISLRQALRSQTSRPVDQVDVPSGQAESMGVISMLSDQLESERKRYSELEQRYFDLKSDWDSSSGPASVVYSEISTCVGSPYYVNCSLECFPIVNIAPQLEPLFKSATSSRRTAVVLERPQTTVVAEKRSGPPPQTDKAVNRLSKIARFRQNS
jgi:hypothetical protein